MRMVLLDSDTDTAEVTTALVPVASTEVALTRPDQNPAAVYLARLTSAASRRTMRAALEMIARLVTSEALGADHCPWSQLRYQHAAALRAALAARYSPSSANKHLSALRGVLRESWRLGQMTADDYRRAVEESPANLSA